MRFFSVLVLSLSLAACGKITSSTPKNTQKTPAPTVESQTAAESIGSQSASLVSAVEVNSSEVVIAEEIIAEEVIVESESSPAPSAPNCSFNLTTSYNAVEYSIRSAAYWPDLNLLRAIRREAVAFQEEYTGMRCRVKVSGEIRTVDVVASMERKIEAIDRMISSL